MLLSLIAPRWLCDSADKSKFQITLFIWHINTVYFSLPRFLSFSLYHLTHFYCVDNSRERRRWISSLYINIKAFIEHVSRWLIEVLKKWMIFVNWAWLIQAVCENLSCMICIDRRACVRDVNVCQHCKHLRHDSNRCVAINDQCRHRIVDC